MISVERRKLMTSELSCCCRVVRSQYFAFPEKNRVQNGTAELTLTSAPMTPRDVRRRYSNGLVLLVVFKNG